MCACFPLRPVTVVCVLPPVLLTETSAEGASEAAGEDRGEAEGVAGDGA